jgi:hypothetical protein
MMLKRWARSGAAILVTAATLAACGQTPTPLPTSTSAATAKPARTSAPASPTSHAGSPRVISFLPACGQSAVDQEATFTGVFEDADGADDLKVAWLLFNSNPALGGGASIAFNRQLDSAVVLTDSASNWTRSKDGGLGVGEDVSNNRVVWRVKQSSAALDGNRLTVTWVIAFKTALANKSYNAYMMATDEAGGTSGWQQVGTWGIGTAPNPPCPSK